MKKTTVSICIPAYNEQHNIDRLLKQIFAQKQLGFIIDNIIVASDGSTDHTVKIAKKYEKLGVKVIEGKDNRGQTYRQNELIKKTTSDILVLMNADLVLKGNQVICGLIQPILKGADLSAQWARPLSPSTILEKILRAGFNFKYYIYSKHNGGNNIYTCVGHLRALSKKFYTQVVFPKVSEGEDQYLYFACICGGYKYVYNHAQNVYFKLPGTFSDYKRYAKRIFQTQVKFADVFSDRVVEYERKLPMLLLLIGLLRGILKSPVYVFLYITLHIFMQKWAQMQPVNTTNVFEISTSTKILNA